MKAYDGSLVLSVKDNLLRLKNAKAAMIGRRGLKTSDALSLGAKISFANHVIRLGSPLLSQVNPVTDKVKCTAVDSSCIEARAVNTVIDEDHDSPMDQAAIDLLKGKSKVLDSTSAEINSKASSSIADLAPPSKIWKITYTQRS
jgi:hypothetical protein